VQKLFKQFEKLKDDEDAKTDLVKTVCHELTIHTELEEELFYPAAREVMDDEDLMDEALVEHASAKQLIGELEEMEPDDELYDAKFTVLGEYVNHHIKEEQTEMFPRLKKTELDLDALGDQMRSRKEELQQEMGIEAETSV
jgi:hemerythrin-like domain-containing protein